MHSSLKISAALLVNISFLCHEVVAQLPPINFESYDSSPVDLSSPDPWEPIQGNAAVTPAGQGFGGGKALKIGVDPLEEAWLRKPVEWDSAEQIAFIDFRIKPAATPAGSQANFLANGTQLAFQLPAGSTQGELWVLHGNDDAVASPPGSALPPEKWYQSAGTFTVPLNSPVSTTWLRATLRHDYQRKIWDLFIDGKLAAVNLGFEGRGENLTELEFFGSLAGDTLIDDLEANSSNMLFPDADKDGLPDDWETANGSNPNLYDRDMIDPATGKSFLDKYLDSLWNAQSPGTPVNGSAGLGNVGTVPPLTILDSHQPVGALKGQFAVGGDGAATYTIPLDIPKGRAGMEPKLSINYSSNAGNGPMGVGWSIGGLQKITRGPSSLRKDGIADGADFDANDRFYLDGERLVCISTGTNPLTNQPFKYGDGGTEYRTEMDSYARITAVGQAGSGPAYWTVETKSGLTITLGGKPDSRVEIAGSGVLSWLVNQVEDTTGRNAYTVEYCDNDQASAAPTASGRYPWKVHYTIDPTMSDSGFCSMNFEYEERPDQNSGYVRGAKQESLLRLKQVAVKTGSFLNHAYNFFYTTSEQTGRSLLYGVDKQAADGSRVPATTFQWDTLFHDDAKWETGHLDFNEYGSGHDSGSSMASFVSVNETDPTEIHLTGNAWRAYPISYTVTPNTRMQFLYRTTTVEPKWGMIGLDENTSTGNPKRLFKLVGGAFPPAATFSDNSYKYVAPGNWQLITIPVGQDYTGVMNYLALVNDDNTVNDGVGESWFRDIRIYEHPQSPASVAPLVFDQAIASPRMMDGNNEDLGVRVQDLNGDGLPDIAYNLLHGKSSGNGPVTLQTFGQVLRNTGSGFVNDPKLKLPSVLATGNLPGGGEGQFASSQSIYAVPVDVNGDGRLDYLYPKNLNRDSSSTFSYEHGYLTWDPVAEGWVDLPDYTHDFKSACPTSQKRFSHFEHIDLDSDGDLDLIVHPFGATLSLRAGVPNDAAHNPGGNTFPLSGNSGSNNGLAYLNKHDQGFGWVLATEWRLPVPLRIPGFNNNGGEVGRGLQDLDGDGRPDLYSALWPTPKQVWLNTGAGWAEQTAPSPLAVPENITNSNGEDVGTRLVDVNGDGRVDALKALGSGTMSLNKGVHLNTGSGWESLLSTNDPSWLPEENFNTIDKRGELTELGTSFVDLNADGLVDFVVSKPSRETVFLNTGSGWWAEDSQTHPPTYGEWKLPRPIYPNTTASTNGIRHAMVVDLNGDGVSDLIGDMKEPVPTIWINHARPERVVGFTDGFAASIQVDTYARLNDPTPVPNSLGLDRRVYDKTPVSALLPGHVSLCDNRWVVARYSEPDGMGGRRYRSQYYRDLRHDKANEASLGFGQIEVHDEVTRGYTVTQTRRDYPFAGSVDLTRSYAFVGEPPAGESDPLPAQPGIQANTHHLVSEESASYGFLASTVGIGSINGAQHFVHRPVQTGSVASKFELGDPVNPISRVTTTQNLADFDGFGFVKKSTVSALDGSSTLTENAYWHDTTGKWLLGRLAASRVTKNYGGASTTKTSGFAYRSSDGLLVKEVVEPKELPANFATGAAPATYDPEPAEPTAITQPDGGHPGGVEKIYGLDGFGNTTSESVTAHIKRETGPANKQTRTKHTVWGHNGRFPVSEDNGIGEASYTYEASRALVLESTDLDDRVSAFEYDSFGTQIATHLPDGTSTAEITRFVSNGHLPPAVIDVTGGATLRWARRAQASGTPWATVYFDSLGREIVTEKLVLVSLTNGTPRFENQYVVNCFDARGRNYRTSNPFFAGDPIHWNLLHHDALDRVYKTTRPDTSTEGILSISVESPGTNNPLSKVITYDAKGNQLQRWTDQHGRMVKSSDASGQETTFSHDPEGRVESVKIDNVEQLANHFDIVGNKWKVVDLSGGTSTSVANGFGEVISATNPHGTVDTLYDHLGRVSVVTKLEGIYTTTYNQSSPALGAPDRINGSGAAAGYMEDFFYGSSTAYEYGKVIEVRKRQSSAEPTYVSRTAYNALGLVMDEWFDGEFNSTPPGDATPDDDAHVRHEYDPVFGSFELRTKLIRGAHQTLLAETGGLTISGSEATATGMLAHGILRKITTDIRNGRILRIESNQGSTELQHLTYAWDSVGNLLSRHDAKAGKTEVFEYDSLNRLKKSTIDSQSPVEFVYETNGNLKSKAGSPNRTYAGYQVETAVVKGQTRFHKYDAAGYIDEVLENNATGPIIREHDWTSFGQLKQVSQTSTPNLETFAATQTYAANGIPGLAAAEVYLPSQAVAQFDFDASGSRAKQTLTRNFGLGSEKRCVTRYLGTYESEVHETKPGNGSYVLDKILHRHRLGGALLTTEVPYSNGNAGSPLARLAVVLTDHIGSTDVIVRGDWTGNGWNLSANQQKAERQSFDAWGGRRDQSTWTDLHPAHNSTRKTSGFDQDRGFTGHEMLDDFGLVHMNGRIYDSELGRFLSPDPYVQVPEYSQNFNRYSYVLNNPLSMTDPSGYLIHGLHVAGFLEAREGTRNYLAKNPDVAQAVTIVVGVVLVIVTGGAFAAGWSSFAGLNMGAFGSAVATGAGTGAFGASAAGGDFGDVLRGAAVGAASAAVTAGILGPLDHATGWAAGIDPATRAVLHVAGHGIVGGLSNAAMGGKFQDGFLSGLVGALASHAGVYDVLGDTVDLPHVLGRTVIAGIIGGTASSIGGGKFANGVYTAAFQHLLNAELANRNGKKNTTGHLAVVEKIRSQRKAGVEIITLTQAEVSEIMKHDLKTVRSREHVYDEQSLLEFARSGAGLDGTFRQFSGQRFFVSETNKYHFVPTGHFTGGAINYYVYGMVNEMRLPYLGGIVGQGGNAFWNVGEYLVGDDLRPDGGRVSYENSIGQMNPAAQWVSVGVHYQRNR